MVGVRQTKAREQSDAAAFVYGVNVDIRCASMLSAKCCVGKNIFCTDMITFFACASCPDIILSAFGLSVVKSQRPAWLSFLL